MSIFLISPFEDVRDETETIDLGNDRIGMVGKAEESDRKPDSAAKILDRLGREPLGRPSLPLVDELA